MLQVSQEKNESKMKTSWDIPGIKKKKKKKNLLHTISQEATGGYFHQKEEVN